MNTSDYTFDAEWLHIPEGILHEARMKLYHSSGDGYYVLRNFAAPDAVAHMRELWTTVDPAKTHKPWEGNHCVYPGCPDYYVIYEDGGRVFYNFLFDEPVDEVTREISVAVHMLRNRLSGRNAFADLSGPHSAVSYRVTHNINYQKWSPMHSDFLDYEKRYEKGQYDPSRLQATLFLSEKGVDYAGDGFKFTTNQGKLICFGTDVDIKPGDLVIWRYANVHGIENVKTPDGQFGFLRIIYPIHMTTPMGHRDHLERAANNFLKRAKSSARRRISRLLRR